MDRGRTGEKALRRVRALVVDAAVCWARSDSEAIARERAVWLRAAVRLLGACKREGACEPRTPVPAPNARRAVADGG